MGPSFPRLSLRQAHCTHFLIHDANLLPVHCDEPWQPADRSVSKIHPPTETTMTFAKALLAGIACGSALVGAFGTPALADSCKEPETGTKETPIFSPPIANVVVGTGRLQFYLAPNVRCPMEGIFVIPRDRLIAYAQTNDGWSSVMYLNPRTGNDVSGWVRSTRLKETGTVGPKQQ